MVFSNKFPKISTSVFYTHYEIKGRRIPKDCDAALHPTSVRIGTKELESKINYIEREYHQRVIPFIDTNPDRGDELRMLVDGGIVETNHYLSSYIRLYHQNKERVESLAKKLGLPKPVIRKGND